MPAQTIYFLSEESYCCEFDDGAVILHLGAGTYVGVHAENLPELRIRTQNWPNSSEIDRAAVTAGGAASEDLISLLLFRGILTTASTPKRSLITNSARETFVNSGPQLIQKSRVITQLPRFVSSLLTVAIRHKDKKLASLLYWLRRRQSLIRTRGHSVTPAEVRKLLASFFCLRIWFYTADRRCLFDSLVLAMFLSKKKVPCTFMIGVSTKPFLAHSWVQVGAFVLNDDAEHVQMFTPILAIGENS